MKKSSVRTFESGRDYAGNRDDHICIKHIQAVFIEKSKHKSWEVVIRFMYMSFIYVHLKMISDVQ